MIIVNGNKFAETEQEFIDSVFTEKSCVGFAKRKKRDVLLMDHQKNPVGFMDCHGVIGSARKVEDGIFYTYATPKIVGGDDFPMFKHGADIREASVGYDKKGYYFK